MVMAIQRLDEASRSILASIWHFRNDKIGEREKKSKSLCFDNSQASVLNRNSFGY